MRPPVPFVWRGIHHGYLGVWFMGFGGFFLFMNVGNSELLQTYNPLFSGFVILGFFMFLDDLIEHTITRSTPLRWFHMNVMLPLLRKIKHVEEG